MLMQEDGAGETAPELADLYSKRGQSQITDSRRYSALGVPSAVPRSARNYVQARWTTSEHADWCMNMRSGDALNSEESGVAPTVV